MKSIKARKQRKAFFNAPLHQKRKHISAHLEENLLLKYDRRRMPVVKGDTVRVMRGMHKGHEDKVTKVILKDTLVEVEGITTTKADGKKVARPIHPSNLLIIKLNLTDKWRRKNLEKGLSDEKKREIETEAKKQLKQIEEEQLKAQAELEKEEKEEEPTESLEPSPEQVPPKTAVKEKKEPAEDKAASTPAKKPKKESSDKKKPSPVKQKEKKATPKKPAKQGESDQAKEEKA
ncbi:MAG: 50S ribosomal protein L24 [Candidatus Thermoplasmatota archaeon]|nr:50S ribosomal protein L24 [Candidatus Thermoplasmatota archaeon]